MLARHQSAMRLRCRHQLSGSSNSDGVAASRDAALSVDACRSHHWVNALATPSCAVLRPCYYRTSSTKLAFSVCQTENNYNYSNNYNGVMHTSSSETPRTSTHVVERCQRRFAVDRW